MVWIRNFTSAAYIPAHDDLISEVIQNVIGNGWAVISVHELNVSRLASDQTRNYRHKAPIEHL